MSRDVLLAGLRQVMMLIGGILVGRGVLHESEVEALATLAIIVASAVWMIYARRKAAADSAAKIETALHTTPPRDPELDQ